MKKTDYEIYLSFSKRPKKYVIADTSADYADVIRFCKKLFKCSKKHIDMSPGWIYKDELYLENPHIVRAHAVVVASYVR